jgi:hypothetical protein
LTNTFSFDVAFRGGLDRDGNGGWSAVRFPNGWQHRRRAPLAKCRSIDDYREVNKRAI